MSSKPKETREAEISPIAAALEAVPRCASLLRAWADRLDKHAEDLAASSSDLRDLAGHTEQLSAEVENSRVDAPVHKSAQSALKKAVASTGKVLKEISGVVDELRQDLAPPPQLAQAFENADKQAEKAAVYASEYRQTCMSFEAPAKDKDKKEKRDKEKRRSGSPRRIRSATDY